MTTDVKAALGAAFGDAEVDGADDVRPLVRSTLDEATASSMAASIRNAVAVAPGRRDCLVVVRDKTAPGVGKEDALEIAVREIRTRFPDAGLESGAPSLRRIDDLVGCWSMVWYVGALNLVGLLVDKTTGMAVMRFHGEMANAGLGAG
jgi:hypothetical protein